MQSFARKMSVKGVLLMNAALLLVLVVSFAQLNRQQRGRMEGQLLAREKLYSQIGAKAVGKILEEAVERRSFTVDDFFDPEYVPVAGSNPPQYTTKYNVFFDAAIQALQGDFLNDTAIVFAAAVDKNGYLPTHQNGGSGDFAKQILNDAIGTQAAQNKAMGFMQESVTSDGNRRWDISSPIYVKEKHWGAFRIGVVPSRISHELSAFRSSLFWTLIAIMLFSIVVSVLLARHALKPLKDLARQTALLADGDIDNRIASPDGELDELAASIERLRVSLKIAMDRLLR